MASKPHGLCSAPVSLEPDSDKTSSPQVYFVADVDVMLQYTIFGKVVRGMEVMHKLEALPTKKEGIFVM